MSGQGEVCLEDVEATVRAFLARKQRGGVDLKRYRGLIDALDGDFGSEARDAQKTGAHLANGNITAASWIARWRRTGASASSSAGRNRGSIRCEG
jgi:hypothetical protein